MKIIKTIDNNYMVVSDDETKKVLMKLDDTIFVNSISQQQLDFCKKISWSKWSGSRSVPKESYKLTSDIEHFKFKDVIKELMTYKGVTNGK